MLRTNSIKTSRWLLPLLTFSLAGCGVTQSVTDGTKSAFNAVFYKKIKVLHLDFTAREALAKGDIVQVLPEWEFISSYSGDLWLLWAGDKHMPARMRAMIDYLSETVPAQNAGSTEPAK